MVLVKWTCLSFGLLLAVRTAIFQSNESSYLINNLENIKGSSPGYGEGFQVRGCRSNAITTMDHTEENLQRQSKQESHFCSNKDNRMEDMCGLGSQRSMRWLRWECGRHDKGNTGHSQHSWLFLRMALHCCRSLSLQLRWHLSCLNHAGPQEAAGKLSALAMHPSPPLWPLLEALAREWLKL